MPSSMTTLPTSVKRKNLIAEYSRRPPPQMPMRKYIGTSITSQNRKKSRKSSATNAPINPVCRTSRTT